MATRDQIRAVREAIEGGQEPLQIADMLNMEPEQVEAVMREMFDAMTARIHGMPVEHMYAELLLVGLAHMRALNDVAFHKKTTPGDKVSAIKGSWAIRKQLMAEGRDMGVISTGLGKVDGIDISFAVNMSMDELRFALQELPQKVRRMESEYKDVGIMDVTSASMFGEPVGEIENN